MQMLFYQCKRYLLYFTDSKTKPRCNPDVDSPSHFKVFFCLSKKKIFIMIIVWYWQSYQIERHYSWCAEHQDEAGCKWWPHQWRRQLPKDPVWAGKEPEGSQIINISYQQLQSNIFVWKPSYKNTPFCYSWVAPSLLMDTTLGARWSLCPGPNHMPRLAGSLVCREHKRRRTMHYKGKIGKGEFSIDCVGREFVSEVKRKVSSDSVNTYDKCK